MSFEIEKRTLVPFFGYIIHSEEQNSTLSYIVKSEGPTSISYIGVPVFQFGYNSYRYAKGTRVYCLPSLTTNKVYILGQIPDPSIAITNENPLPREGEMILNSGDTNNSGIIGLGKSQNIFIFAGKNKDLQFNLSPYNANLKFFNTGFSFEKSKFSLFADEINSFSIIQGKTILKSELGISLYGGNGDIFTSGNTFAFYQDDLMPGIKKTDLSGGKAAPPDPQTDYSFYIGKNSHNFNAENGYFNYKGGFSVKIGITDGAGVLFSIIKGNFQSQISQGSFKFSIIQPAGNSYSIKIGPNINPLSSFVLDSSSLKIEIGALISNSLEIDSTGIILKSKSILGDKGDIKLDGNVEITGKLIVNDKIYSTDEVYAQVVKILGEVSTTTAVGLSTHQHPTGVPGPPSSPIKGT
jgi:hypothetical protein